MGNTCSLPLRCMIFFYSLSAFLPAITPGAWPLVSSHPAEGVQALGWTVSGLGRAQRGRFASAIAQQPALGREMIRFSDCAAACAWRGNDALQRLRSLCMEEKMRSSHKAGIGLDSELPWACTGGKMLVRVGSSGQWGTNTASEWRKGEASCLQLAAFKTCSGRCLKCKKNTFKSA